VLLMRTSSQHSLRQSLLQQWLRPYRSQLAISALLAALSVPLLIAQLWWLADIAASLLQHQPPPLASWLGYAALFVLRQLLLSGKELLAQQVSRELRRQLRQQLLQKIALLGPARQRFGPDGSLSTLITEQVDALDGYISRYWPQLVQVVVAPLLIAIAVGWHSLFAAALLLCTAPLVPLFMVLVGREASKASQQQLQVLSRMGGRLYIFLQGLPLLKRLNATGVAAAHLQGAAERYQKSTMQVLRLAFLSTAVLELFTSLAIALVALYLGLGLLGELPWLKQQVPVLYQPALFILLLAPEFYQPLRQLGNDYHAKAQAQAATLNLTPLWKADTLSADSPPVSETPAATTPADLPAMLPELTTLSLHQIVIGNPAAPRLQIEQLLLHQGKRYLLQGPSGCGKSTLLQLLAGFIPGSGQMWLNQQSLEWAELPLLRQQMGYLTQQAELWPGTVADNLQLAKPDASTIQMQAVLQQVGLWHFLQQQQGLQTVVGEGGRGLSGGQQQRLALARLLLQEKAIWLLDEPVAELDADSAAQICALLAELSIGKTVLFASHHWHHLCWLDQVLSLENGVLLANRAFANADLLQQEPG
jgi:ATP-binding cassette subfamily C protein CydD